MRETYKEREERNGKREGDTQLCAVLGNGTAKDVGQSFLVLEKESA